MSVRVSLTDKQADTVFGLIALTLNDPEFFGFDDEQVDALGAVLTKLSVTPPGGTNG